MQLMPWLAQVRLAMSDEKLAVLHFILHLSRRVGCGGLLGRPFNGGFSASEFQDARKRCALQRILGYVLSLVHVHLELRS